MCQLFYEPFLWCYALWVLLTMGSKVRAGQSEGGGQAGLGYSLAVAMPIEREECIL